ncbi:hypothetical protein HUT16_37175 [Kitasatospora sp. NA04385]|uniref:hypothetical protein n=1 Tax=Kitasatospora sp. NA04385 TaxID=2742135 RepID=UPI0015929B1B|nr:hypothetical protein [Kitasatospora sp. NA04385]QKW23969.1 hypothetical protein HUT16_37175 [Kitasatospora sp. NA04385]
MRLIGMLLAGVDGQYPSAANGSPWTPLARLHSRDEVRAETVKALSEALDALRAAYAPTRKHPDLARPRTAVLADVVGHLRDAAKEVEAVLGTGAGRADM